MLHHSSTSHPQGVLQSITFWIAIMLANLVLVLTGCNGTSTSKEVPITEEAVVTSVETPVQAVSELPADAPIYKVSNITTFEPYVFSDENGIVTGFDIDLLNAIAEKAGFGVEYYTTKWPVIFDTVTSGNKDMIISVVTITPERQEFLSFSEPYINFTRSALVDTELSDKSFDDLIEDESITFSVVDSTRSESLLKELGVAEDRLIPEDTQFLSIRNVMTGKADAVFEETNMLKYYYKTYADDNSKFTLIEYNTAPAQLGIAVNKGNTEVLDKVNYGLDRVKEDGTYQEIYDKWFSE